MRFCPVSFIVVDPAHQPLFARTAPSWTDLTHLRASPCRADGRGRSTCRIPCACARVRLPSVGTPHGVTGWRPPFDLPSPPPCGWSTGFIAEPRTGRALALPAAPARLAAGDVLVVDVADLADGRPAGQRHAAHLARREAEHRVAGSSFATSWMPGAGRCGPSWPPLARLQLDVVDERAGRDVLERQRVAGLMSAPGPDSTVEPTSQPRRREDVAFAPSA